MPEVYDMTLSETLERLYKVLEHSQNWTKHVFNTMIYGEYAYCLVGAVEFVDGPRMYEAKRALRNTLISRHDIRELTLFNDDPRTTHKQVLELIQATIARVRANG